MEHLEKYNPHIEKRQAVAKAAFELEHRSHSFKTDLEPLRNELLHLESLREEVVTAVSILLEADERIVESQVKADEIGAAGDELGKLKQQGSLSTAHAWTRMSLSWKIFLYSVRCFQDCTYKSILHAQQQGVGPRASMSTCAPDGVWRDGAGVGKLIAEHLPGYPEWFIRTRKLRNKLKQGLSVQSVWKGREHFIVLCGKRWNGPYVESTEAHPLKFEFAKESLEMCAAVANLIPVALNETRVRKQARALRMKGKEVDLSLGSEHWVDLVNRS